MAKRPLSVLESQVPLTAKSRAWLSYSMFSVYALPLVIPFLISKIVPAKRIKVRVFI